MLKSLWQRLGHKPGRRKDKKPSIVVIPNENDKTAASVFDPGRKLSAPEERPEDPGNTAAPEGENGTKEEKEQEFLSENKSDGAVDLVVTEEPGAGKSGSVEGDDLKDSMACALINEPVYCEVIRRDRRPGSGGAHSSKSGSPLPGSDSGSSGGGGDASSERSTSSDSQGKHRAFSTFGVSLDFSDYFSASDSDHVNFWEGLDSTESDATYAQVTSGGQRTSPGGPGSGVDSGLSLQEAPSPMSSRSGSNMHLCLPPEAAFPQRSPPHITQDRDTTMRKKTVTFDDTVLKMEHHSFIEEEVFLREPCGRLVTINGYITRQGNATEKDVEDIVTASSQGGDSIKTFAPSPDALSDDGLSLASDEDVWSEDMEYTEPRIKVKRLRGRRTTALLLLWFFMGLQSNLIGVSLPYLMDRLRVTYEPISRTFVAEGIGGILGAIVAGVTLSLSDVTCDIIVIGGILVTSCSLVSLPWITSLRGLAVVGLSGGFSRGISGVGSVIYLRRLWGQGETTGRLIQLLFVAWAGGAILAPQLVRPFTQTSVAMFLERYLTLVGGPKVMADPSVERLLSGGRNPVTPSGSRSQRDLDGVSVIANITAQLTGNITSDLSDDFVRLAESPSLPFNEVSARPELPLMAVLFGLAGVVMFFCVIPFLGFICYNLSQRSHVVQELGRIEKRKRQIQMNKRDKELARAERLSRLLREDEEIKPSDEDQDEKPEEVASIDESDASSMLILDRPEDHFILDDTETQPSDSETQKERPSVTPDSDSTDTSELFRRGLISKIKRTSLDVRRTEIMREVEAVNAYNKQANGHAALSQDENMNESEIVTNTKPKAGIFRDLPEEHKWFKGRQTCGIRSLSHLYTFCMLPAGITAVLARFLFCFAVASKVHMSGQDAALLLSVFWGSVFVGRLMFIVLGRQFAPNVLIISCHSLCILALSILAAYGYRFRILLWLFTAVLGTFLGPVFPASLSWTNSFFNISPRSVTLIFCIHSLGIALLPWLVGFLMDYTGLMTLPYVLITAAIMMFLLFLPVMKSIGRRKILKVKVKKGSEMIISSSPKTYI